MPFFSFTCTYTDTQIHIYTYTHIHIYTYIHIYKYIYIYTSIHLYIYTSIHLYIYSCIYINCTYNIHIHKHIHTYKYATPPQDLPFLGLHVSDSCSFPSRQKYDFVQETVPLQNIEYSSKHAVFSF